MGSGSCLLMDEEEFSVVMKTSVTSHIIRRLTEPSPIPLFNPDLPTIVTTDTSDYGLGAVLSQLHPNHTERTVAFASKTQILNSRERGPLDACGL